MGSGVPFLNDYKLEFFWKRVPQTVLGGPRLRLGYDAPAYVYLNQVVLFLLPWLIGGLFTILSEFDIIEYNLSIILVGLLMVIVSLIVQFTSWGIRRKLNSVEPLDPVKFQANTTDEEDEIEFMSCCGGETVEFVIPGKKYVANVIIHSILCGPLCALGTLYLLPETLNALYDNNAAATALTFIFGWITMCMSTYSLIVNTAPETAIFRSVDPYEFAPLMRPFYVMVFIAFDLVARSYESFEVVNYYLHILFILLPLFWTIGMLPPLDALFLWLFEQALFILFGGSPMSSDLRLVCMVIASCAVYLVIYFVPQGLHTVILMAAFGFLLSTNLGGLFAQVWRRCTLTINSAHSNSGFMWHWGIKEVFYHLGILALAIGVATVVNYFAATLDYSDYIGYAIIGLLVIVVILADVQSVYVLFGLWRNKLYPHSVQRTGLFNKRTKYLRIIGFIRRMFVDFVCPVVMLAYMSMSVKFPMETNATNLNSTDNALEILGTARAFRWAWQSTQNSLLEMSVAQILKLALPDNDTWATMHIGVQLLLLSFARDRLFQMLNKLYFFWTTLFTSWTVKKQRRKSSAGLIAVNLILLPLNVAVICVASVLAAPLLPLFTLPVFLIGFPRPLRCWPEKVGTSANKCSDTIFYEQAAPQLALALRKAFSAGSIGDPTPGKHYLIRFQDRMAWIHLLERGYGYCTISLKGLELQETSCHTVEATRIDDIIEFTYEQENGVSCCMWNKYAFNTLRPVDAAYIKALSDAKNQLTGVIDSPDVLKAIVANFRKTLVWVVVNHVHEGGSMSTSQASVAPDVKVVESKEYAQRPLSRTRSSDDWNDNALKPPDMSSKDSMKRSGSIKSFANSIWSDDDSLLNEALGDDLLQPKRSKKDKKSKGFGTKESDQRLDAKSAKLRKKMIFDDDIDDDELFGILDEPIKPKKDTSRKMLPPVRSPRPSIAVPHGTLLPKGANIKSSLFTSSSSSSLSLPPKWTDIPIDTYRLKAEEQSFPGDWYKHVISSLKFKDSKGRNGSDIALEVSNDKILANIYSQFVGACHLIVNDLGLSGTDPVFVGANHVSKVYKGNIPWSTSLDWLKADKQLMSLVVRAYRYSVKVSIDEMLLGPASSDEEMAEYMTEYDDDWYIGMESDPEWMDSIRHGVPQLFSFSQDTSKNTYHSRVLTCQDTAVFISSLNQEAVRGQWANLNLELFYMTNDDEERYSIQAHPTLLRNLTVQSADPPLGYPIYASPPITVPTL